MSPIRTLLPLEDYQIEWIARWSVLMLPGSEATA